MSFSEAIAYQRDIVAVKSGLLAAMMPCDGETSAAMTSGNSFAGGDECGANSRAN